MSQTEARRPPPRSLREMLAYLGPGLIISANIVGSGELIATLALTEENGRWDQSGVTATAEAGAEVLAILDTRAKPGNRALADLAKDRGIELLAGWMAKVVENIENEDVLTKIAGEVQELCSGFDAPGIPA